MRHAPRQLTVGRLTAAAPAACAWTGVACAIQATSAPRAPPSARFPPVSAAPRRCCWAWATRLTAARGCVRAAGETCADDAEQQRGGAECTVNEDCGINDRGTGGTCVNGKCSCFPGYFCPTCNTDTEPNFAGGEASRHSAHAAHGVTRRRRLTLLYTWRRCCWYARREVPGFRHWRRW